MPLTAYPLVHAGPSESSCPCLSRHPRFPLPPKNTWMAVTGTAMTTIKRKRVRKDSLNDFIARLPASERRRIEARAKELIAEEMSLQDLRRAVGKTQTAVARRLKVGQDAVSKLETRSDMYISTL